jgi:hypothetical protein
MSGEIAAVTVDHGFPPFANLFNNGSINFLFPYSDGPGRYELFLKETS